MNTSVMTPKLAKNALQLCGLNHPPSLVEKEPERSKQLEMLRQ